MVEQWPFKPFVTGSNPVRPIKNMFKKLLFAIYFIPLFSFSQTVSINDEFGNKLNANYINNDSSKTIVVILHGTRGHKKLELIQNLSERFSDSNIDTLSMNLSYGITNRNDDFLPCNIILIISIVIQLEKLSYGLILLNKRINMRKLYYLGIQGVG